MHTANQGLEVVDVVPPAGEQCLPRASHRVAGRLPRTVALGWGAAEWAGSTAWAVFGTYFLFFMTDVVGLNAAVAGTVVLIVSIVAGVVTPPVGILSDSIGWRWGRRRPFLLIASAPLALTVWLMFTDWGLGSAATFAYFATVGCLWSVFYALQQVPLTALAAEMTLDYNERTRLVSYRTAWSQAAYIATQAAPLPLAAWIANRVGSETTGWSIMMAILALTCVPPVLWAWRATRGRELYQEKATSSLREMWLAARLNKSFWFAGAAFVGTYCTFAVYAAVLVYFMTHQLGFSEGKMAVTFILLNAAGLLTVPLVERTGERLGKRQAMVLFNLIWTGAALGMLLVGPSTAWLFWVLTPVIGMCIVGGTVGSWAFIPDCTEVDEYKSGNRREGLFYSLATLAQMFATAVAVWLVGALLGLSGYDAEAEQLAPSALTAIHLTLPLGTAFFTLLTALFSWLQPMDQRKHAALVAALEQKRAGKPVTNEDEFADLL